MRVCASSKETGVLGGCAPQRDNAGRGSSSSGGRRQWRPAARGPEPAALRVGYRKAPRRGYGRNCCLGIPCALLCGLHVLLLECVLPRCAAVCRLTVRAEEEIFLDAEGKMSRQKAGQNIMFKIGVRHRGPLSSSRGMQGCAW